MSQEKLDELCEEQPDCQSVLFADIATGVALISDSGATHNRSFQSTLCAEAERMLGNQKRNALFCDGTAIQAFVKKADEVRIFLRNPEAQSDALCCICAPSVDIDAFMRAAHKTLAEISE